MFSSKFNIHYFSLENKIFLDFLKLSNKLKFQKCQRFSSLKTKNQYFGHFFFTFSDHETKIKDNRLRVLTITLNQYFLIYECLKTMNVFISDFVTRIAHIVIIDFVDLYQYLQIMNIFVSDLITRVANTLFLTILRISCTIYINLRVARTKFNNQIVTIPYNMYSFLGISRGRALMILNIHHYVHY